jgi:hypothetical protein
MKQILLLLLESTGGLGVSACQRQVQADRCVGRDKAIIGSPTGFEGEERERVCEVFAHIQE